MRILYNFDGTQITKYMVLDSMKILILLNLKFKNTNYHAISITRRTWLFVCILTKNNRNVARFATIWDQSCYEVCGVWSGYSLWSFFFCHVRHVELYGASHVLRFGVFIISRTWFSWILTIIDYGLVILWGYRPYGYPSYPLWASTKEAF